MQKPVKPRSYNSPLRREQAREARKLIAAGPAASEAICDQASDLANTFGELELKSEAFRAREKKPILDAGREIDRVPELT